MALTCYEEKIARRQNLLELTFSGLREHLGSDFEYIELNRAILHNVVQSYFHDVNRHKNFHGYRASRRGQASGLYDEMDRETSAGPVQLSRRCCQ